MPGQFRLFDARKEGLGPYYLSFGQDDYSIDDPALRLQAGLDNHTRWKRWGDEEARERFVACAEWAANAQRAAAGVSGSYDPPRSAIVQSYAISLLLRAYQETGRELYLVRSINAATPFTVDVRDGGMLWRSGDDFFLEGAAGSPPSHVLSSWICALWSLFEISRVAQVRQLEVLYSQSLATLDRFLPCYDSGRWSYDGLFETSNEFRRLASPSLHRLHTAQLNVLLSMTRNELFVVVVDRWRRYGETFLGYVRAYCSAIPEGVLRRLLPVPRGARCIV